MGTSCGNLATAESGGSFGTLAAGPPFTRDLQIPPGGAYAYGGAAANALVPEARYVVTSQVNSAPLHPSTAHWHNLPGHAGGAPDPGSTTDGYLAVNGSTAVGVFYRQDISLVANQNYRLSMFAINAINLVGYNGTWPNLRIRLVRASDNAVIGFSDTGAMPDKEGAFVGPSDWSQATIDVNSGAATAFRLEVLNLTTSLGDNDFAIDDVTIAPLLQAGCPIDFGDAPDTGAGTAQGNYQSLLADNGARHGLVAGLFLGTTATAELDALQNATATGDTGDDGATVPANLTPVIGNTFSFPVTVSNTTGTNAFVVAYIDWNSDGDFVDAGEQSGTLTYASGAGATSQNASFTIPSIVVGGPTFVRVRLGRSAVNVTSPIGIAADGGEVEDYRIVLANRVTLNKVVVPAADAGRFNLQVNGSAVATNVGNGGSGNVAIATAGSTVTIAELAGTPSPGLGNYTTTLACTGATVTPVAGNQSGTFTMPGADVNCTFTNTRTPRTVTVVKALVPTADPGRFDLQINAATVASNVGNGGSGSNAAVTPGTTVTVAELVGTPNPGLANYTTTLNCPGATVTPGAGNRSGSFTMPDANVTCTFTNTRIPRTVTVVKALSPVADAGRFNLQINAATVASNVGNGGSGSNAAVTPGTTVTVAELAGTPNTGLANYTTTLNCPGATVTPGAGNQSGSFTMPDANVTCTFTNTRIPRTVTLNKTLSPAADAGRFDLQVNGSTVATNVGNGGTGSATTVVPGTTVTIAELAGTPSVGLSGYATALACTGATVVPAAGNQSGTFTMPDADVSCTFTNTSIVNLAVTKTATPTGSYLPGQPLNYSIVVTNNGPGAASSIAVSDTVPASVTV
ncbi:GEVED domain-containing protein, partial [Tahibacter aquaticus]|uniref:GEVED domain-containing protein n=1 Tax=Tahibacter aquaticus TaxID=520092 RepID=UPI001414F139